LLQSCPLLPADLVGLPLTETLVDKRANFVGIGSALARGLA
jgi:hypothetical protein